VKVVEGWELAQPWTHSRISFSTWRVRRASIVLCLICLVAGCIKPQESLADCSCADTVRGYYAVLDAGSRSDNQVVLENATRMAVCLEAQARTDTGDSHDSDFVGAAEMYITLSFTERLSDHSANFKREALMALKILKNIDHDNHGTSTARSSARNAHSAIDWLLKLAPC
jgi:hypothetical protein